MREIFTTAEAADAGISADALGWGKATGAWSSGARGAYWTGDEPVTVVEQSMAEAHVTGGAVSGAPAGELLGLDAVVALRVDFTVPRGRSNRREGARRRDLGPDRVIMIDGVGVTSGLQTLLDLAADLNDDGWEQALESALRMDLASIAEIEAALPEMSKARIPGVRRIRRVLGVRPDGAPPTESLLETLAVQMIRHAGLPTPTRQVKVFGDDGRFVARVDLAWPELGVFLELDGQQHKDQPVYDAARQTAVAAATGWLCARCTWRQVTHHATATARDIAGVLAQGKRRGFSPPSSLRSTVSRAVGRSSGPNHTSNRA